jgi:hypothetical protein
LIIFCAVDIYHPVGRLTACFKSGVNKMARKKQPVGNRPPVDIKAEARLLPKINPAVVNALQHMLVEDQGMMRPPEQAARLLALIHELAKAHKPFPHREVAAQVLGGNQSKYTVDAILSQRMAEGYISLVVETTMGHNHNRVGVRKQRFFVPSMRLVDIAQRAERMTDAAD